MTIQFKVDSTYTLGSSVKLICTYIEDNTVWLKSIVADNLYPILYKLERKTNKLYVFNEKVQAYDSVENTLSEYGPAEIWDFRKKNVLSDYLE